jgi:23S rRNA (cytidine1920-2'-O)/16S rRNA (cytidine1409-2'-O)-methyltransferase
MRIDELLVRKGLFSTRQKAKEAIKRGAVIVEGVKVTKPSKDVDISAKIAVLEEEHPKGYWKLKELNEKWNFIKTGMKVLDLGSSAGGFLLYCSELADCVVGIEYSREFDEELRKVKEIIQQKGKCAEIFFDDALTIDLSKIEKFGKFDVILDDLTLPPVTSFKALKRFLGCLKESGKVLFIAKTGINSELPVFASSGLEIKIHEKSKKRKESYYLFKLRRVDKQTG